MVRRERKRGITSGRVESFCQAGNVNLGAGALAEVLTVNGQSGPVVVSPGQSIAFGLASSPSGPAPARYCLWVWLGFQTSKRELAGRGISQPILCLRSPLLRASSCSSVPEKIGPRTGRGPSSVWDRSQLSSDADRRGNVRQRTSHHLEQRRSAQVSRSPDLLFGSGSVGVSASRDDAYGGDVLRSGPDFRPRFRGTDSGEPHQRHPVETGVWRLSREEGRPKVSSSPVSLDADD